MITSDHLYGALLGGGAVAVIAVLAAALVWQLAAKRTAISAREAARQQARVFEQEAEEALKRAEANGQWYQAVVNEFGHLVDRLRAVADVEAGHPGVEVPGLLHPFLADTPVAACCQEAEDLVRERAAAIRGEVSAAARAGVRGIADAAQASLTRLQLKIDQELSTHSGSGSYLRGLTEIDHLGTQALHSLQRLRILAGSWPGVQRDDCTFREIIESAKGRIGHFLRIDYSYQPDTGETWVEGRVAEPVIVALAELLDNATSYSDSQVDVYAQRVQAGCRVVVEDRGLGMNSFQRAEAERLLSQHAPLDAASLKDERRLGFAVIGRLAHDYGFRVDVSAPSSSGGVKAVCLVPAELLSDPAGDRSAEALGESAEAQPAEAQPAEAQPAEARPEPVADPDPVPVPAADVGTTTASGLPKRQARQPAPAPPARPVTSVSPRATADPIAIAGDDDTDPGLESIFNALRAGYADPDTDQGQAQP
ncbi:hypothetical protein [Nonomuraea sp. NPDC048826]|uniref:hypothetical protein n=1 Tax=Nonomuraea sp. NPDC048826 TaxID=3364347 RepID=UPI00371F593C